jgi:uncharacterized protein with GYD domain
MKYHSLSSIFAAERWIMAKFLFTGSYTTEGRRGMIKEGGSKRQAAVDELFRSLGGRLEAMYFAFGDDDFVIIGELPDTASAVAGALVPGASGTVQVKTTVLISAEEMDQATQKSARFRPAGT